MGLYIEVPSAHNKVQQILDSYSGHIVTAPKHFNMIDPDFALVCVVDNGTFEAAGFVYSQRELDAFSFNDGRPKVWLVVPSERLFADYPRFKKAREEAQYN